MMKEQAQEKTLDYFNSGFNCAEALAKTFVELFSDKESPDIPRVATAFGGGMGGSHEETCGAYTGAIIVIGYLRGRSDSEESRDEAYKIAMDFRKRFMEEFGWTTCMDILRLFGEQNNLHKCKKMTSEVAGMLVDVLLKDVENEEAEAERSCEKCALR